MASIPASRLANVIPGVLGTGGNPLALNAVYLTTDPSIPVGTVQPFASATAVEDWFGPDAPETLLADVYFGGFTNCTQLPGTLYFSQWPTASIGGYLRGGSVEALSLAQIQALAGTITIQIDGQSQVSSAINLSAASSPSNAAALIQTALNNSTGRFAGTASQTASTDLLTVSAVTSGTLTIGDVITGTGVDVGLTITGFGTGTGGTGTYMVSTDTGFASTTISVAGSGIVSYDSLRDAFVIESATTGAASSVGFPTANSLTTGLKLTAAAGAVQSPGSAAVTPAAQMNVITSQTQNFAAFMTVVEQTISVKEEFAAWLGTTVPPNRYAYSCQDSDVNALVANNTECFGYQVAQNGYSGVLLVYDTSGGSLAAFQTAYAASINFSQLDGRTTLAYRNQAGLVPQVTNETQFNNLQANGYNCFASFATANEQFSLFQNGQISGPFKWADSFFNQVYLNSQFQLSLIELQANTPAVPYVTRGYNLIRGALLPDITDAINFGSIVPGVVLSASEVTSIIGATGDPNAAQTLQSTGYYLQILDPGAIVRGGRGSPTINFWYTDGESVQVINMSSVNVQ